MAARWLFSVYHLKAPRLSPQRPCLYQCPAWTVSFPNIVLFMSLSFTCCLYFHSAMRMLRLKVTQLLGARALFFFHNKDSFRVEIKSTIPSPQRAKSSILLVDRFYVFKEITLEHPQMGRLNWKLGQGNTTEPISPIRLSCTKKSYLNYLSLKFKDISQCQTHCKYYLGHVWPTETQNVSMTEALLDRSDPEFLCCAGVPTCLQCAAQAGPSLNLFLWSAPSSLPLKLIQCKPILIGTFPGPSSMLRCLLL